MYYCKNVDNLHTFIKSLEDNVDDTLSIASPIKVLIQVAKPHYSACVKLYYLIGQSYISYEKSLDKSYFDKENGPAYGEIIRDFTVECSSITLDSLFPFKHVKKFMIEFANSMDIQSIGVDLLICERDYAVIVFDLNPIPGYHNVENI
jgi:hypothetical protein